jgi:hypothetical protein
MNPVSARLAPLRETPRYHWAGLVAAIVLGLALASVHWLGLVAGGALVGIVSTSFRRALLAGLGFGVLVVVSWVGLAVVGGVLGKVLATGQLAGITVAIGLVAPVLGSLVRGIV